MHCHSTRTPEVNSMSFKIVIIFYAFYCTYITLRPPSMASVWPAVKVDEINFYLQLLCSLWQCLPVMNEAPSEARKTMVSATCKFVLLSHALILYVLLILKSYSDIRWLTNFSRGHYSKATYQYTYRAPQVVVHLGWVDSDLGSSPGWRAATVATYCPGRVLEHL